MTLQTVKPRSLPLRATDGWSISEGTPERRNGLEKLLAALLSWLRRPRRPPDVPAHLRSDLGLPPLEDRFGAHLSLDAAFLTVVWRRLN